MSYLNNPVTFNGIELTAAVPGLTVLKTNPYVPAKRELDFAKIARTSTSRANSGNYSEKTITVRVNLVRNSRAQVEQSKDILMGILQPLEKQLVLPQSGSTRLYYASLADAPVREDGGMYMEIDLMFALSDRFGYDVSDTQLLAFTGYNSANKSDQLQFGGSAEWQVPTILLTLDAVAGGTSKTVNIGNADTGQNVAITRNFIAGDVISVNSFLEEVRVNGTEVAFTGAIPKFKIGSGYWYYGDNFTSRTLRGRITYPKRYV